MEFERRQRAVRLTDDLITRLRALRTEVEDPDGYVRFTLGNDGRLLSLFISDAAPTSLTNLGAQVDPDLFFPEKGGSTRDAKRICGRCEVRAECLEKAVARDERFGIWGGMSPRERNRIHRRAA